MRFKNLDELIEALLKLQKEGKGHYNVKEDNHGEDLEIVILDGFEEIFFQ